MLKWAGLMFLGLVGLAHAENKAVCPDGGASQPGVPPIMAIEVNPKHTLILCGDVEESAGLKAFGNLGVYVSEFDLWALGYPRSPLNLMSRGARALFEFSTVPRKNILSAIETIKSPIFDRKKKAWIERRVPFVLFQFKCDLDQCFPAVESCAFRKSDDSKAEEAVAKLNRKLMDRISMKQLTNLEERDRIVSRLVVGALAGSKDALRLIQRIAGRKDLDGMVGEEIDESKYILDHAKKVGCLK